MSKYKNRQKFGNINSFSTVYEIQDFIISRTEAGTACPSRTYAFTAGFMTGSVLLIFLVYCLCYPIMCHYVLGSLLWYLLRFPHLTIFGSSYLQLSVGEFMSYLHFVCLLAHSGVQCILCCVFVLFFFVLFTLCFSGLSIFFLPFGIL